MQKRDFLTRFAHCKGLPCNEDNSFIISFAGDENFQVTQLFDESCMIKCRYVTRNERRRATSTITTAMKTSCVMATLTEFSCISARA